MNLSWANSIIESLPFNIMMADKDFNLIYLNKKSIETLETVKEFLPKDISQLVGSNIDIFHKNPMQVREILSAPENFPLTTKIHLGEHIWELVINQVFVEGESEGYAVAWSDVGTQVKLAKNVTAIVDIVSATSMQVEMSNMSLVKGVNNTVAQSDKVSVASSEVSSNIQTVAVASEEMNATIQEIMKNITQAAELSNQASSEVKSMDTIISSLETSSKEIGNVVTFINSIAEQTNLLALNATIEAARAGEAGKGFAVVAGEVKELSKQTQKATTDISEKVNEIQANSHESVKAVDTVAKVIENLRNISASIAAMVEEQSATMREISMNASRVSDEAQGVNTNIEEVKKISLNSQKSTEKIKDATSVLSKRAKELKKEVKEFFNFLGI